MNKPYDNRTLLGVVRICYNEDGQAEAASFAPAAFRLPPEALTELCKVVPHGEVIATKNTERIIAQWLLRNEAIEVEDRELARLETVTTLCELWPSGLVKTHEVEVYYAKTI